MTCGALGYIWTMLSHFTIVPSVVCEVFHRQMEIKTGVLEVLFISLIVSFYKYLQRNLVFLWELELS